MLLVLYMNISINVLQFQLKKYKWQISLFRGTIFAAKNLKIVSPFSKFAKKIEKSRVKQKEITFQNWLKINGVVELRAKCLEIKEYLKQKFPKCPYKDVQIKVEKSEEEVCL